MGFIRWIFTQYRIYRIEHKDRKDMLEQKSTFVKNYYKCIDAGFTTNQLNALINLMWSYKHEDKGERSEQA